MRSQSPSEQPRGGSRHPLGGVALAIVGLAALLLVVTAAGVLARTSSGGTTAKVRPVWTWSPPMPHRRSYTASTEIGGKIYVAAGMVGNSGKPLDLFERFDPKTERWSSLTPLPHEFSAAAGAKLGPTFYVIGGNSPEVDGRQVSFLVMEEFLSGFKPGCEITGEYYPLTLFLLLDPVQILHALA